MTNVPDEVHIPVPELRGGSLALISNRDIEVCLDGPAGTGKTFGALFKIHALLTYYPTAKALVARKTNTALAGSALATYRDLLDPREDVRYFGGNKVKPAAFEYPNGSVMIVNGLDKPDKVKSWEFDIAYINEATECELEDIEFVRSRLRHDAIGYNQLIMDVNPGPPTHWLNQRMNMGITKRLLSRHKDNPRFYDLKTQDWTEDGKNYIFGVLGGLTGVRKLRLRDGIWAAAEGTVYEEEWDPAIHIIDRFEIPESWSRYWSIDFGFRNPFVWQAWAENPDGELFRYREIYITGRLVEDLAAQIMDITANEPRPVVIVCDHDAEDRATFEKHTGYTTHAAPKAVSVGIQTVQARLRKKKNGRPSIYFLRDSLVERDSALATISLPTCTESEFESYVWDTSNGKQTKEEPLKKYDHGMDATRYLMQYLEQDGGSIPFVVSSHPRQQEQTPMNTYHTSEDPKENARLEEQQQRAATIINLLQGLGGNW